MMEAQSWTTMASLAWMLFRCALSDNSFGVGTNVSWDLALAERGCQLFLYDHTIDRLPLERECFHWKKLGIGPATGDAMTTVADAIAANGHRNDRRLVMKMDIEDSE